MKKERKQYTAEEKVTILRRHLLDKVPVSDLCEELSLKPTVFYRWQKEFFENGAVAFQAQECPDCQVEEKQKRIEYLEKKVQTKDGGPGRVDGGARRAKKNTWGTLTGNWVPHDVRDQVVDFVRRWSEKTEIGVGFGVVARCGVTEKHVAAARNLKHGMSAPNLLTTADFGVLVAARSRTHF